MGLSSKSSVMIAKHPNGEQDWATFSEIYNVFAKTGLYFEQESNAVFIWHLIQQAKADNVYPQAVNYLSQVVSVQVQHRNLAKLLCSVFGAQEVGKKLQKFQAEVAADFEEKLDPELSTTEIWYNCRVAEAELTRRVLAEKEVTEVLTAEKKQRMKAYEDFKKKAASKGEKVPEVRRIRSSILKTRRAPPQDSQSLIRLKVTAFADIFLTTKAMFLFDDDVSHYLHAKIVIEKMSEKVAPRKAKEKIDIDEENLKQHLDDYLYWLMHCRKNLRLDQLCLTLTEHDLTGVTIASPYSQTYKTVQKLRIQEDIHGWFPSVVRGWDRPVHPTTESSISEHDGKRSMAILAYESSVELLVFFRIVQEQVHQKNLTAHNKSTICPKLPCPVPDEVNIPGVLSGIEQYLDPDVPMRRKKKPHGIKSRTSGSRSDSSGSEGSSLDSVKQGLISSKQSSKKNKSKKLTIQSPWDHKSYTGPLPRVVTQGRGNKRELSLQDVGVGGLDSKDMSDKDSYLKKLMATAEAYPAYLPPPVQWKGTDFHAEDQQAYGMQQLRLEQLVPGKLEEQAQLPSTQTSTNSGNGEFPEISVKEKQVVSHEGNGENQLLPLTEEQKAGIKKCEEAAMAQLDIDIRRLNDIESGKVGSTHGVFKARNDSQEDEVYNEEQNNSVTEAADKGSELNATIQEDRAEEFTEGNQLADTNWNIGDQSRQGWNPDQEFAPLMFEKNEHSFSNDWLQECGSKLTSDFLSECYDPSSGLDSSLGLEDTISDTRTVQEKIDDDSAKFDAESKLYENYQSVQEQPEVAKVADQGLEEEGKDYLEELRKQGYGDADSLDGYDSFNELDVFEGMNEGGL